ncbi:MAG: pimeloyl-ACP methyl ester carboxylesterase [Cellvibrionaceae bacterium]
MSITTLENQLVHYEVTGHGTPVIFVHGWHGSWRYWWPTMQALSAGNRTYAFDLWGFGDSSQNQEKYSLDAYVEMLHGFLDALAIRKPVILVGHSLGAAVALRYTLRYPKDVERVAAISLPVKGSYMDDRLAGRDPFSYFGRTSGISWPEVDNEVRKSDIGAVCKSVEEVRNTDFLPDIRACSRPMMLVFGKQDQIVKEPGNSLPEATTNRAYISLESDHFPMLEQKVQFNRLVLDFALSQGDMQAISPKDHWVRRNR